jgi:hypothetical protein
MFKSLEHGSCTLLLVGKIKEDEKIIDEVDEC